MSKTMAAHEPINYLDSILNEEEKRCEYSHQWRNFTISRSGRFKSKNKHRNVVDGKMFDRTSSSSSSSVAASLPASTSSSTTSGTMSPSSSSKLSSLSSTSCYDKDKISSHHYGPSSKSYQTQQTSPATKSISSSSFTTSTSNNWQRDKVETYKSYYETNL